MNKNTKKALIIGGIAVAAGAGWYFFFGPGATPAYGGVLPSSSSGSNQPVTNSILPWFLPSNATLVSNIKGWIAQTSAKQQAGLMNYLTTQASQADINNLWSMIQSFNGGPAASAALQAWWSVFSTTDTGFAGS
jgi:hypothetical protein